MPLTNGQIFHVAPIKWQHMALTRDYLWSEVEHHRLLSRSLQARRFSDDRFTKP
jgi:hypothetical protein